MSFDYSKSLAVASAQISDKGRNVTYRSITEGTYYAATNTRDPDTEADTTIKAVEANSLLKQLKESTVEAADRMLLVAGDSINPTTSDKIIDNGETYQIVFVERVHTGDTAILYKLQIRK